MATITAGCFHITYKIIVTALTAFLAFLPLWLCLWMLELWRESCEIWLLVTVLILPISFIFFWLYAVYRFWQTK